MNNLHACASCQCVTAQYSNWSPKTIRSVEVHGALTYYRDGLKMYVKECCLFGYYFGNPDMMSTTTKQSIPLRLKSKAPKYVVMENVSFVVYDISSIKKKEKTTDPNSMNGNDKMEIVRNVFMSPSNEQYEIITKSGYDRMQKALVKATIANVLDNTIPQYVYLIQERTAVVANQPIYKIGRSEQSNFTRFKGYAKGYRVLLHMMCDNCRDTEAAIMKHFKCNYRQVTEYGAEYFEGDWKRMRNDIFNIVNQYSMME